MKELNSDNYNVFIYWDCFIYDSVNTIRCYFAEFSEEEFAVIHSADQLWYDSLRKRNNPVVVERRLDYILDNSPGDIFFQGKRVTKKFASNLKHMNWQWFKNLDFTDITYVSLNDLIIQLKGSGSTFPIECFQTSQFCRIKSTNEAYDYILIPGPEILKRFYLFTSVNCYNIHDFANYYKTPENPFFDIDRSTIAEKEIFIFLKKNVEEKYARHWAKFLWNKELPGSIISLFKKQMINLQEIPDYFSIAMKWPEVRIIEKIEFQGRPWVNNALGRYFIVTNINRISSEKEWKEMHLSHWRENDNEQIPDSPNIEEVLRVRPEINLPPNQPDPDTVKPVTGHKPGVKVEQIIIGREDLLWDLPPSEKKHKLEQKIKTIPIPKPIDITTTTEGPPEPDSEKGGAEKVNPPRKKKNNHTDENPLPEDKIELEYSNYWKLFENVKQALDKEADIKSMQLEEKPFVDNLKQIKNIIKTEKLPTQKKIKNAKAFCQRNKYKNSHDPKDKKIRTFRSLKFLLSGKKIQYIEVEPLSNGTHSFIMIDRWIDLSDFRSQYVKYQGNKSLVKSALKKSNQATIKFIYHPHWREDEMLFIEELVEKIKSAFFTSTELG